MAETVLKSVVRKTILFSLPVFITGTILFATILRSWFLPVYFFLFFLFLAVSIAYSYLLIRAAHRYPGKFIAWFMGITMVKFLLYFLVMVLYLLFYREHAVPFLLTFLVFYFSFTAFAISLTLRTVNKTSGG